MCPKCQSLNVTDITVMDDKQRWLFCGDCGHQGGEIDFLESDGPVCDEPKPSLLQRFIKRIRR